MERRAYLNLEPVTFVGTYAASLPVGNVESSRPAVLVEFKFVIWAQQEIFSQNFSDVCHVHMLLEYYIFKIV